MNRTIDCLESKQMQLEYFRLTFIYSSNLYHIYWVRAMDTLFLLTHIYMINLFRWLSAGRRQAITRTNIDTDLCRHILSFVPNELVATWLNTVMYRKDGLDCIQFFITMWYSISQEICTRFLLCCALLWLYIDWFSHIHQAYFTGTVAV